MRGELLPKFSDFNLKRCGIAALAGVLSGMAASLGVRIGVGGTMAFSGTYDEIANDLSSMAFAEFMLPEVLLITVLNMEPFLFAMIAIKGDFFLSDIVCGMGGALTAGSTLTFLMGKTSRSRWSKENL